MINPKVAFSKDFLAAYARLPKKIQKKVRQFTEKFQQDPTQSGLNFEKFGEARDDKVRSVRIDQAYRLIIIHPPRGDVYLCVWVDHHDDAYQWVKDRVFEVNPTSGSFQIYDVAEAEVPASETSAPAVTEPRLFDTHDDEELLLAGVPGPLLASVRNVQTEEDLDHLAPHLPSDAAEMLFYLAAGFGLLEAMSEADRAKRAQDVVVDTEDFTSALDQPQSQSEFKVLGDQRELEQMLDAPLEQWRIFLHPSQKKVVEINANGPVRVLGGAGTGKTVALMHRANYLAEEIFSDRQDRLLVTTFTRNLSLDLSANLRMLCSSDAFSRIEVTNIHSWTASFMRRQGHSFKVANDSQRNEFMEAAVSEESDLPFSVAFFLSEWDDVVQAQEIDSRDEYLTARRIGRGVRLTRKQRVSAWEVFFRYREMLTEHRLYEWPDVVREARLLIEKQDIVLPYSCVLCDEVQDLSASALRLLRAIAPEAPNSLFLVGDGHQRIYGQPLKLSSCGIDIRGRGRRLKLNYRTTQQIRERAVAILEGREFDDLDGGIDSLAGYQSLREGPTPEIKQFGSEAEEAAEIATTLRRWLEEGVPATEICVAARTNQLISSRYVPLLEAEGIDNVVVRTDPESEAREPGVRVATMHRMKGLEFRNVMLVGAQGGAIPNERSVLDDEVSKNQNELMERCLLYVAATRARDELVITGFGQPCPFL